MNDLASWVCTEVSQRRRERMMSTASAARASRAPGGGADTSTYEWVLGRCWVSSDVRSEGCPFEPLALLGLFADRVSPSLSGASAPGIVREWTRVGERNSRGSFASHRAAFESGVIDDAKPTACNVQDEW